MPVLNTMNHYYANLLLVYYLILNDYNYIDKLDTFLGKKHD